MKITQVTPSKKKNKYDVYVDGEFFATIPEQTLLDYRVIATNSEVDEAMLEEILRDSMRASAYVDALNYVASTMRTSREVRDKLSRIGYTPDAIEEAMRRIEGYGYLDDRDYAINYVDKYRYSKGIVRIRHELSQKGVAEELIYEALIDFDEYEPAKSEAERFAHRVKYDKVKLFRHLAVRGYSIDVINRVVSEVVEEYDE